MSKLILCLLALFLVGCEDDPKPAAPTEHVVVGYVRNVWCYETCFISFETEDKKLISLEVWHVPPVWTGLHCKINYHEKREHEWGPPNAIDYVERID